MGCFLALATILALTPCAFGKANDISYKELWFRTKLDHFAFHNNKTFKLRYLLDDRYWDRDGGPIFMYTGNENSIELFAEVTGALWEWAPEFGALVVFAEHRFFGKSLPFGNKSSENAAWYFEACNDHSFAGPHE